MTAWLPDELPERPLWSWKGALVALMAGSFVGVLLIPWFREFFMLELPGLIIMAQSLGIAAIFVLMLELSMHYMQRYIRRGEAPQAVEELGEVEAPECVAVDDED